MGVLVGRGSARCPRFVGVTDETLVYRGKVGALQNKKAYTQTASLALQYAYVGPPHTAAAFSVKKTVVYVYTPHVGSKFSTWGYG